MHVVRKGASLHPNSVGGAKARSCYLAPIQKRAQLQEASTQTHESTQPVPRSLFQCTTVCHWSCPAGKAWPRMRPPSKPEHSERHNLPVSGEQHTGTHIHLLTATHETALLSVWRGSRPQETTAGSAPASGVCRNALTAASPPHWVPRNAHAPIGNRYQHLARPPASLICPSPPLPRTTNPSLRTSSNEHTTPTPTPAEHSYFYNTPPSTPAFNPTPHQRPPSTSSLIPSTPLCSPVTHPCCAAQPARPPPSPRPPPPPPP